MPNYTLGRNLHLCFTKLKRPLITTDDDDDDEHDHHISSSPIIATTTTTRTTSSSSSPSPSSSSTTRRTPSSVLIKNYNSLYEDHYITPTDQSTSKSLSHTSSSLSSSNTSDSDDAFEAPPPDFAAVFASQRFFFSSPGLSNSIIESLQPPEEPPGSESLVSGGVPIPTYSPDPYMDFRRSMQEMVEARELLDVKADWDYLHELLVCYLDLNPKHAHKFIIGAFADLLVTLMETGSGAGGCRKSDISGRCEVSQQVV